MGLAPNWYGKSDTGLNRYRYNGIERNDELGLDLAPFRSYDASIGRWLQVDPMAEVAPGWTPYRFGFNNPISWSDPWGLFESRKEARQYRREHNVRGRVRKQENGQFGIVNRREHSITINDGELGVVKAAYATAQRTEDPYSNGTSVFGTPALSPQSFTYVERRDGYDNRQRIDFANTSIVQPLPQGGAGIFEYVNPVGAAGAASAIFTRVPKGEIWMSLLERVPILRKPGQYLPKNSTTDKFFRFIRGRSPAGSSKSRTFTDVGNPNQYGNDVKDYLDNVARKAKHLHDGGFFPGG